ncbi:MAG: hypothetical protein Rhob2KO_50570 [Rhodopirellula baltica]
MSLNRDDKPRQRSDEDEPTNLHLERLSDAGQGRGGKEMDPIADQSRFVCEAKKRLTNIVAPTLSMWAGKTELGRAAL